MESKSFNWDAADFFRRLTETNKLALVEEFQILSREQFGRLRGSARPHAELYGVRMRERRVLRLHRFDQQPAYRSDKNSVFRRAA